MYFFAYSLEWNLFLCFSFVGRKMLNRVLEGALKYSLAVIFFTFVTPPSKHLSTENFTQIRYVVALNVKFFSWPLVMHFVFYLSL